MCPSAVRVCPVPFVRQSTVTPFKGRYSFISVQNGRAYRDQRAKLAQSAFSGAPVLSVCVRGGPTAYRARVVYHRVRLPAISLSLPPVCCPRGGQEAPLGQSIVVRAYVLDLPLHREWASPLCACSCFEFPHNIPLRQCSYTPTTSYGSSTNQCPHKEVILCFPVTCLL